MAFKYSDYKRKLDELTESAAPTRKQNPEWENQKAQIKDMHRASLEDLSSQLDPHYQRSDDYSHFKKHDAIAQQINWLKKQIGESDDSVDEGEIDFGSISKTLSKYGTGVPAGTPKKPSRSTVNPDYTMTGHREKTSSTGRVYSKVLTYYDDDFGKAAKATKQPDQVDAPKRGRGRPAGASNKEKSYKPWSDEARASLKAKLAAKKAAKAGVKNESEELEEATHGGTFNVGDAVSIDYHDMAGKTHHGKATVDKATKAFVYVKHPSHSTVLKFHQTVNGKSTTNEVGALPGGRTGGHKLTKLSTNESEEYDSLDESFVVTDGKGQVVHTAYSESGAKQKAAELTRKTGVLHAVKFHRTAVVEADESKVDESLSLDEQDWADIVDDHTLDEIAEFMLDEDYENLDELSKATLGSYIKKASRNSTDNAVRATAKITNKEYTNGGRMAKKSYSRQKGIDRAVGKLT
jgi:hypothetical protein